MAGVRRKSSVADDAQLAALGHVAELHRNFSPLAMLGMAFAILNSWTALAASLSLALPSGGATSVLWGLVTAGVCNLALAASLAEFLSAYPTAGGQYHWVAVISWERWMPLLSWVTGWINVAGWVALVCTGGLLGSQLIVGVIAFEIHSYNPQRWHQFLIYIVFTLIAFVINGFGNSMLPHVNKAALFWSILGFVTISITVLATSSGNYASAEFVFTNFLNQTGWPDGIAWLLGLLQGGLGLTAYDAVAHMIEEIPNAAKEGPKIMIGCVVIGIVTGFIFLMVLLFVSGGESNLQTVITSSAGPLLEIFYLATSSHAGAIVLLIFPLCCLLFATISIMTTASRMIYASARDGMMPFSPWLARINYSRAVPLNALLVTTVVVILFGCIFLGSTAAFNAIISASVVALTLSYGIPIAVLVARGRSRLPSDRPFALPSLLGWAANVIGLVYVVVTTVLFLFPPALPVDAASMNYCVVAFAIVLLVSTVQWWVDGRKNFHGPRIDAAPEVLEALGTEPSPEETVDRKML